MPMYQGVLLDEGGAVTDIKAYGAVGDSVTDDTAAIVAAYAGPPDGAPGNNVAKFGIASADVRPRCRSDLCHAWK